MYLPNIIITYKTDLLPYKSSVFFLDPSPSSLNPANHWLSLPSQFCVSQDDLGWPPQTGLLYIVVSTRVSFNFLLFNRSLFSEDEILSLVWMHYSVLIHSSTNGHLDCFQDVGLSANNEWSYCKHPHADF